MSSMSLAVSRRIPPLAQRLAEHLRESSFRYFGLPQSEAVRVSLLNRNLRPISDLYTFQVEAPCLNRQLLVKSYLQPARESHGLAVYQVADRPSLFPRPDVHEKAGLEHQTLSAVYKRFARLKDARFTAIRMYGHLPSECAVIMEHVTGASSLQTLFAKSSGLTGRPVRHKLHEAFHHAGAWLRIYHESPALPHTMVRHRQRSDFEQSTSTFVDYLASRLDDRTWFERLFRQLEQAAKSSLPDQLPVGLSHTDFAPRNVLVRADGSIAVCDTLGRWLAPIYEDAAHFLIALETSERQMNSQGLLSDYGLIAGCRNEFLKGYFGTSEWSSTAVRVFEVQLLLCKWVNVIHSQSQAAGWQHLAKSCRMALRNRFLKKQIELILTELLS